ncbi:hypothetical protein Scep_025100 [Stephania cephalantha]|uniref:Uncharacterized protein n=1 Tax=Stephania cephalantha TaxID=152367 RepID=A0AAP0HZ18_9MAGN
MRVEVRFNRELDGAWSEDGYYPSPTSWPWLAKTHNWDVELSQMKKRESKREKKKVGVEKEGGLKKVLGEGTNPKPRRNLNEKILINHIRSIATYVSEALTTKGRAWCRTV